MGRKKNGHIITLTQAILFFAIIGLIGGLIGLGYARQYEAEDRFATITSQIKAGNEINYKDLKWWMSRLEATMGLSNLPELIGYPDNELGRITVPPVEEMPPDPVIEFLKEKVNLKATKIEQQKAEDRYKIWQLRKMVLQKEVEKRLLIDQKKELEKKLKS